MNKEDLIILAKKGDDEAYHKLIDIIKEKLYRIALAYLKNEQDSLEAIQEVTYRAYIKIHKLKEPKYFDTWIVRIMINYCVDELKRKRRIVFKEIEATKIEDSTIENSTIKLTIEDALNDLAPKYKTVIILKYFNDYTIKDIAKIMNRPESTIKTWLGKSIKSLRKYYDKGGDIIND